MSNPKDMAVLEIVRKAKYGTDLEWINLKLPKQFKAGGKKGHIKSLDRLVKSGHLRKFKIGVLTAWRATCYD